MKHIALAVALASAAALSAAALTVPSEAFAFEIYGDQAATDAPLNLDTGPAQYSDPIQYRSHDEGISIGRGSRRDYVGEALIPGPARGAPGWTYSSPYFQRR